MASSREQLLLPLAQTISLENSIFAPLQLRLEDIPVVEYKFDEKGKDTYNYKVMMKKRKVRQGKIASLLLGKSRIPVAPFPNPRKSREISHHIIRMTSARHTQYAVDVLVRDTDLYVAAFRRRLDDVWGTWYHYDDQTLPDFITGASKVGFQSDHKGPDRTLPGGIPIIDQIFLTLAKHEERLDGLQNRLPQKKKNQDVGSKIAALRRDLEKAMLVTIIMFSEANHFRCIYKEIVRRIEIGEDASQLDATMWSLINNWGQWSNVFLKLWAKDPVMPMEANLPGIVVDAKQPDLPVDANQPMESDSKRRRTELLVRNAKTNEVRKLKTVEDMVGPKGQLMFIKQCDIMIDQSEMKRRRGEKRADFVEDRMFVELEKVEKEKKDS